MQLALRPVLRLSSAHVSVHVGAQFGDEEEEEDEAGPMEGVTEAVPDAAGQLSKHCLFDLYALPVACVMPCLVYLEISELNLCEAELHVYAPQVS